MSGSTEQLGKKISGAKDLGGVVRAMKALAASSVGQYERAVEALDDYLRTVELGLIACLHGHGQGIRTDTVKPQHAPQIGAVIFGSDQGLVGSFNEVLVEFSLQALRALPGKVTQIHGGSLHVFRARASCDPRRQHVHDPHCSPRRI